MYIPLGTVGNDEWFFVLDIHTQYMYYNLQIDKNLKNVQHSASASIFSIQVFGLRLRPNVKMHLRTFTVPDRTFFQSDHIWLNIIITVYGVCVIIITCLILNLMYFTILRTDNSNWFLFITYLLMVPLCGIYGSFDIKDKDNDSFHLCLFDFPFIYQFYSIINMLVKSTC